MIIIKVKELIEILSKLDQDKEIGYISYDDEGDDWGIEISDVTTNQPKYWAEFDYYIC